MFFNFCVPHLIFVTNLSLQAGQFLARNENIDDGVWREVFAEVHADADRLFKMIGEAYTLLSDPTKVMNPEFLITDIDFSKCSVGLIFKSPRKIDKN